MPEYGIDAIFALYGSKCILVGVALRLYFRREDIIRPYDTNGERRHTVRIKMWTFIAHSC